MCKLCIVYNYLNFHVLLEITHWIPPVMNADGVLRTGQTADSGLCVAPSFF